MDPTKQPGIRLQTVFLKEATFRHRSEPLAGMPVEMQSDSGSAQLEISVLAGSKDDMAISVLATDDPDVTNSRYEFRVEMVAIFETEKGKENMPIQDFALRNGAALLYPFVRETVANLTSRGRFGPLWLNPFNISAVVQAGEEFAKEHKQAQGRREAN
jgi:preprotein translocase subunit SecB